MESNWRLNVWDWGLAGISTIHLAARTLEPFPGGWVAITGGHKQGGYGTYGIVPGQAPTPFGFTPAAGNFPHGVPVLPD